MKKSILMVSALMLFMACGGKKTGGDAAVADSTSVKDTTAVADSVQTVTDEATDEEDAIDDLVFALDLKSDKSVLDRYMVKAYPAYFLIDTNGTLCMSPAPSPSEDFETRFRRIFPTRNH